MEKFSVVVSGFDRYEDVKVNPSYEVPKALEEQGLQSLPDDDGVLDGIQIDITTAMLPVSFSDAWPRLREVLDRIQPDIVVATGLKHAARGVALERCATNQRDASSRGDDEQDQELIPIRPDGPAAYWTRLPLRSILTDFSSHGIPATLSSDAGTYVCNSLFYNLLNWTAKQEHVLSGFVSFPLVNESASHEYGLPIRQQIAAGQAVIRRSVRYFQEPTSPDVMLV
ncbi:pyroglutamyl-peptidase I [Bifidobacterium psychraerophilum]|jgi:pyroglutamyl-peptidase|uniref:Pyroglutamyl-peptidase I n=1 Tax=Bifidobacterium psychraerophilum TaxID=218140 RepID=A0A087CFS0_9BIFI|nr:pyroglutamyl-peptidase I [Bifidobacterium psychraerophilum]KFI82120.1 pyroglutamyl-peptidase I [Bifidobacterium psychraerophilum]MCI1660042.1 pyroglutamyl-peptidase I [Bifidobacterium psychraerophilum]MCI1804917.1 pyroglutamyl-peptidase I [Bifidobacterium psychraerophilum]MCI2177195.1 pyroglutamyl-peptidase I [Bifidobacterium psychraerophilum]MCI2182769.1 pyroglutamyl-peptidase I [Bifidobacterium psychraerophilum]